MGIWKVGMLSPVEIVQWDFVTALTKDILSKSKNEDSKIIIFDTWFPKSFFIEAFSSFLHFTLSARPDKLVCLYQKLSFDNYLFICWN